MTVPTAAASRLDWRRPLAIAMVAILALVALPTLASAADSVSATDAPLSITMTPKSFVAGEPTDVTLTVTRMATQGSNFGFDANCYRLAVQGFDVEDGYTTPVALEEDGASSEFGGLRLTADGTGPYLVAVTAAASAGVNGCNEAGRSRTAAVSDGLQVTPSPLDPEFTFDLSRIDGIDDVRYGDGALDLSQAVSGTGNVSFEAAGRACAMSGDDHLAVVGAGDCEIEASLAADEGYQTPEPITRAFNIAQAVVAVSPDPNPAVVEVGDALPTFTPIYSGWVGEDDESLLETDAVCGTETGTSVAGTFEGVVLCDGAVLAGDFAGNYVFEYAPGDLIVRPTNEQPGNGDDGDNGGDGDGDGDDGDNDNGDDGDNGDNGDGDGDDGDNDNGDNGDDNEEEVEDLPGGVRVIVTPAPLPTSGNGENDTGGSSTTGVTTVASTTAKTLPETGTSSSALALFGLTALALGGVMLRVPASSRRSDA
jgi:LPXTG-motif cell wall-anchored protein